MEYYHATFFTNRDSILTYGLVKNENRRIWRISDKRFNYLTGTEEDAIEWMISWYGYQLHEAIYGNLEKAKQPWKHWNMVKEDEIRAAWYLVPRIDDGLAVFEIKDTRDFHFFTREDREGTVDYVTSEDIPPEYIRLMRFVPSEEVQHRVFKRAGIRKPF